AGRAFDARDAADALPVVIVNEALAGRLWPGQRAVGRRIRLGNGPLVEVVGVVKTGKYVFLSLFNGSPNVSGADPIFRTCTSFSLLA
ncbi:MAG TPA: ABC transporter permease, partial [Vicinamibacterales bacterium]|nr:ABC transporter permease [Vicinamibacterales bacterium]